MLLKCVAPISFRFPCADPDPDPTLIADLPRRPCSCTNLFFYLVLDIGNEATDSLPFGIKFVDAVLDAAACRNAGYQPIPMSSLMPAVQYVESSMHLLRSALITPTQGPVRGHDVHRDIPDSHEVLCPTLSHPHSN